MLQGTLENCARPKSVSHLQFSKLACYGVVDAEERIRRLV